VLYYQCGKIEWTDYLKRDHSEEFVQFTSRTGDLNRQNQQGFL